MLVDLQAVVEPHLREQRRVAQVALLQRHRVLIERAVVAHGVRLGVAAREVGGQAPFGDGSAHVVEHGLGVAAEERQRELGRRLRLVHGRAASSASMTSRTRCALPTWVTARTRNARPSGTVTRQW